jgi:hypothetical protein
VYHFFLKNFYQKWGGGYFFNFLIYIHICAILKIKTAENEKHFKDNNDVIFRGVPSIFFMHS